MIVILSPAKTLDFETESVTGSMSQPIFKDDIQYLVGKLKKLSAKQISNLMNVNSEIAELNFLRYQGFESEFHGGNSKQAVLAFTGEVYRGLAAHTFSEPDFEFAQKHLRILSGLYGVLRPLDMMQPYRLEMGSRLKITPKKIGLYNYWEDRLRLHLEELAADSFILNLASNEYLKGAQPKQLQVPLITCHFKELKGKEYKSLMTYAKNARGAMAKYIVKNEITDIDGVKGFNLNGYRFHESLSTPTDLTFTRDKIPTS